MFKNKRIEIVNKDKMNEILAMSSRKKVLFESPENKYIGPFNMYIQDKIIKLDVTTRINNVITTYRFFKDGSKRDITITGERAYVLLRRMAKFHVFTKNDIEALGTIGTSIPILYYKKKKQETTNCIGYDINSAYSWAMLQPIPNTKKLPKEHCVVEFGEIGFTQTYENGKYILHLVQEGRVAQFVYPLIESPFKKFVNKYYNIKKTKKGKDRDRAKQILNYAVGYLQRKNPFIRATIVERCNNRIRDIIKQNKEHVLYANTDAIVSDIELDLTLSDEIGCWKIEHQGTFRNREFNFQRKGDTASVRGVSKQWLENYDLLEDEIPQNSNRFILNYDKMKLEESL